LQCRPEQPKPVQEVKELATRTWPRQEARAHLHDVVDSALEQGPQRITRHGKQAVIVVSEEEWNRRAAPPRSFGDWLAASPLSFEGHRDGRHAPSARICSTDWAPVYLLAPMFCPISVLQEPIGPASLIGCGAMEISVTAASLH
jgi:prevent-host-death family protein